MAYRKFNKTQKYMDNPEYKQDFPDKPYGEKDVKDHISIKALRGLPKSSYSVKADPYDAVTASSVPYNILSPFLRTVGGNYAGEDNIDGGNVQQYPNSTRSKFLSYFDSFRMRLMLNYRYLPMNPEVNAGTSLVDEMIKSIAEAVSTLQSTTFTNLAIDSWAIWTDMNLGARTVAYKEENESDDPDADPTYTYNYYTDTSDVIYACSIYYQVLLQEILTVMSAHNSFRLKQGTMIRDAWGREVPILNSFFGLMNKAAFLNLLDSINLSFEGEYVDRDFMEQVNLLTIMPSRRSNSITDPTLEIQCQFDHPTVFKIFSKAQVATEGFNPETAQAAVTFFDDKWLKDTIIINSQSTQYTIWEACEELKTLLTMEDTKNWARSAYASGNLTTTDTLRYNNIKSLFDVITTTFTIFKPLFADYRECLDTMVRTGTISWFKGFRPSVTRDTDASMFQNLIVDDIYKLVMSGADSVTFNDKTKRWTTFSQWNVYTGVPEYDTKQGGSFITFSAKTLLGDETNEGITYLPIMFYPIADVHDDVIFGSSRDGRECAIGITSVTMNNNAVLDRLAPLVSQSDLKIRVPTLISVKAGAETDNSNVYKSTLNKTLTQIFGMCKIGDTISVDPDLLAIYQIEISDITNAAITYARANAPFRGTTSAQGILGFFGMSKGK